MNFEKALKKQKEIELEEIKKDRKNGVPVRINPNSLVAKEIEYQTYLLKEILEEIHQNLAGVKKQYKQNSNDIDTELCLESIKNNKTLFNAEIFLDRILNVELCKMLNILYLECKNECGYFNKEIFMRMSENLYKKISTRYEGLVNAYSNVEK